MADQDPGRSASSLNTASLAPEELSYFLMRHRRGETLERFDPRLDYFLRDILSKANEFVPSTGGAILLDDPRAKIFSGPPHELAVVTGFGDRAVGLLGRMLPVAAGLTGKVYATGRPQRAQANGGEALEEAGGELVAHSLLGVPVVLGNSVCGVLLLMDRQTRPGFSEEDGNLLQIFASYISSSIQNMLDGLRAKELARRDDLTGLFNDRYFHFRLREEIARCEPQHGELSLLFIDLDHFKAVNDSFGHLEGSRVLHEVGILLGSRTPTGAVVARYGGDEFVVILPGHSSTEAATVAAQLQALIEAAPLTARRPDETGPHPYVTASVGVASLNEHIDRGTLLRRANALIRTADSAMYQAKVEGRNRVVVATRSKE